jgi:XTP/dITP diphosphohydrolase
VRILLASQNTQKLRELAPLFAPLGLELVAQPAGSAPVDEDQPTFRANARKKATAAALASGEWCLADDSGLEVDALGGAPGVNSARFAGAHGDDAANNARLLACLSGVPDECRGARFVCALCLARPDGAVALEVEGTAHGRILHAPRGSGDFGYDPLFLFTEPGCAQTGRGFAELSVEAKSAVSHRGRALRALVERLPQVLGIPV